MYAGRRCFDFRVFDEREIIKRVSSLRTCCSMLSVLRRPSNTGARRTLHSTSPEA